MKPSSSSGVQEMASQHQISLFGAAEEVYISGSPPDIQSTSDTSANPETSASTLTVKRYRGRNVLSPPRESEFHLTQEDLRIHGPLNLHLPVLYVGEVAQTLKQAWAAGLDQIVSTSLREHQIQAATVALEKLKSYYSASTLDRAAGDFIQIEVSTDQSSSRWLECANDILRYCKSKEIGDVNVQIATPSGLIERTTRTINPDHPAVAIWDEMVPLILDSLMPRMTARSIDLISRGKPKRDGVNRAPADQYCPTVLIGISRKSDEDWATAADAVKAILLKRGLDDVAVEFYREAPMVW